MQTAHGFVVTYNLAIDPSARVYQHLRTDARARRLSNNFGAGGGSGSASANGRVFAEEVARGAREVTIRFRMVIQIDAGIARGIALEDELVVATQRPAAVQCIRWTGPDPEARTRTELLGRLPWMAAGGKKGGSSGVVELVHDRAMSLFIWVGTDGRAWAVQRRPDEEEEEKGKKKEKAKESEGQGRHFRGFELHAPVDDGTRAMKAAINARFSLLAVGCAGGQVHVYTARDYAGSLPLSHRLEPPASLATTGAITVLAFSPDGYGLFVGYEKGWVLWSVYGKMGGHSFVSDSSIATENGEQWLLSVGDAAWISGGAEIVLINRADRKIWVMDLARSALPGCFGPANVARMLLVTESELLLYRGHDVPNILSLSAADDQWHRVPIPALFLVNQRPIRGAVTSPDGRYVAVAGRRGLAHYSVQSRRWKMFDAREAEGAFVLRGGMLWFQHVLIAAVDTGDYDEVMSLAPA